MIDQVIPRILGHNGYVVIHASSVEVEGRAIAIAGGTGLGKSTLAAGLHTSGYPLLGDDSLLLSSENDRVVGTPGYRGLRIWEDVAETLIKQPARFEKMAHYSTKKRLIFHEYRVADKPVIPVDAIFELAPADSLKDNHISITALGGAETIMMLLKHAFIIDPVNTDKLARKFACIASIARLRRGIYRLQYPRDFNFLPAVQAEMLGTLYN